MEFNSPLHGLEDKDHFVRSIQVIRFTTVFQDKFEELQRTSGWDNKSTRPTEKGTLSSPRKTIKCGRSELGLSLREVSSVRLNGKLGSAYIILGIIE